MSTSTATKTLLLPVTRQALPFVGELLRCTAERAAASSRGATALRFRIAATSREHERHLRERFPQLLADHPDEPIADWTRTEDLREALADCDGAVLLSSGAGGDVFAPHSEMTDWLACDRNVARALAPEHTALKLSWVSGLVSERSCLAVGRAHWEVEQELAATAGQPRKVQVVRATTGMDAFLHGRLFDLVCGRTLSMSVKRGKVAFIHPLDVAESLSALILQQDELQRTLEGEEPGVCTLTGPEALSFSDVAMQLSKAIGETVHYSYFPPWAVQPARWIQGVGGDAIEEELAVTRALDEGAQQQVTSTAATLLGRQPRSFRDFVDENAYAWPRASS